MDPITAVAVASAAFKGLNALVSAGKDIDDAMGLMGKWFGAVSDFYRAEEENKNPPMFKKLFFAKSVEEEAMQIFINKKKLQEQEQQLKTLIEMYHGPKGWQQLIQLRRQIKADREKTVYKQREMRRNFVEAVVAIVCVTGIFGIVGGVSYFLFMYQ